MRSDERVDQRVLIAHLRLGHVVTSFDVAPRCEELPAPTATSDEEMVVDVIAAGLHPRIRSQADGSHYTSTGVLPLVPGIDGVGRGADGRLRYFVLPDTRMGALAEQTVIDARRSITLPEESDPIAVAAAMSSCVALRRRVGFQAGQSVLVLGATGNAGRMAIEVAKRFGAGEIIAAGRSADRLAGLPALGATDTVLLDTDARRLGQAACQVDVVLDYLWGEAAATAIDARPTPLADVERAWAEAAHSTQRIVVTPHRVAVR